jgi:hypothetical protein
MDWFNPKELALQVSHHVRANHSSRELVGRVARAKRTSNAKEAAIARIGEERLGLLDRMGREAQPRHASRPNAE